MVVISFLDFVGGYVAGAFDTGQLSIGITVRLKKCINIGLG